MVLYLLTGTAVGYTDVLAPASTIPQYHHKTTPHKASAQAYANLPRCVYPWQGMRSVQAYATLPVSTFTHCPSDPSTTTHKPCESPHPSPTIS